jgi:hypothetical protein
MGKNFSSLPAFGDELGALAKEIEGRKKRDVLKPVVDEAVKIIDRQVSGDLTQSDFSGWTRNSPIKLTVESKFVKDNAALITPTRQSAGPFTVLDQGRNQGNAGGFAGPGVNRRTGSTSRTKSGGIRKQRNRQARRWNGTTRGKGSSSKAVDAIEKAMPDAAGKGLRRVMSRRFDVT